MSKTGPHKNILFIAIDDLRPEINCFGKKKLVTPHIDRLASSGVRFDRAFCQYPQCMPSRASMLSGVRPNDTWRDHIDQMCPNGEPSLPRYLKENGYSTISVGKIYHYNDDDTDGWTVRYTDTFYEQDYTCHGYCSGYQSEKNRRKLHNFSLQFGPTDKSEIELPPLCECVDAPDSAYPDGVIAERSIEVLREFAESSVPFFLAAGFYRPHLPWAVPKKYWDLYDRAEVDLADNPFFPTDGIGISDLCDFLHYGDDVIDDTYLDIGRYRGDNFPTLPEEKQRECVHGYWASVSFMDAQVGKLLQELQRLGLEKDTLIVFWGDNGWHLGEHNLWSKVTSFEESTRVPLIVATGDSRTAEASAASGDSRTAEASAASGDARTAGGSATDALVELIDIYPTICEYAGLPVPDHVEGTSFLPLLEVLEGRSSRKKAVFSRVRDAETVRTERYRLTRYNGATSEGDATHLPSTGQYELFDHFTDPQENINVTKEHRYAAALSELISVLEAGWKSALQR